MVRITRNISKAWLRTGLRWLGLRPKPSARHAITQINYAQLRPKRPYRTFL